MLVVHKCNKDKLMKTTIILKEDQDVNKSKIIHVYGICEANISSISH